MTQGRVDAVRALLKLHSANKDIAGRQFLGFIDVCYIEYLSSRWR